MGYKNNNVPMSLNARVRDVEEHIKNSSKMLVGKGDYEASHSRIRDKRDSIGIIYAVFAKKSKLFAAVIRTKPTNPYAQDHDAVEFYSCKGDPEKYSLYEIMMRVINIDLSKDIVDPRKFIGQKVLVTELNNVPVKVEFIGEVEEIVDNPTRISTSLLRSLRNFIGPTKALDDQSELTEAILQGFGVDYETAKALMETKVSDAAGLVLRMEGDAVYSLDTDKNQEGVKAIKTNGDLFGYEQATPMKTKDCHLPIKIFSAR